jgi:hypothetical protein
MAELNALSIGTSRFFAVVWKAVGTFDTTAAPKLSVAVFSDFRFKRMTGDTTTSLSNFGFVLTILVRTDSTTEARLRVAPATATTSLMVRLADFWAMAVAEFMSFRRVRAV